MTRHSYGSVILEIDKQMLSSVLIPLPKTNIIDKIGNLVLKANHLRDEAWNKEQEAIHKLENLIAKKQSLSMETDKTQATPTVSEYSFDPNAPPIWELVAAISAQVPDEEWKKLPTDLAKRFDDYQRQKQKRD